MHGKIALLDSGTHSSSNFLGFQIEKQNQYTKRMPNVIDRSAFQDPCDFDSVPNGVEWSVVVVASLCCNGRSRN